MEIKEQWLEDNIWTEAINVETKSENAVDFKGLWLKNDLLKALTEMGYTIPTKIQLDVIKDALEWKNIIGQSQTGTGKTAAFVLSLLQNIDLNKRGTQALIIAPTRELVTQIKDEIFKLTKYHRVKSLAVFGWSPIMKQRDLIRQWQDIIIGTPWRVIDLIERNVLKLEHINFFVLDEVDRMLDMWFVDDIDFIWNWLKNLKQVLSFSATITPEIKTIIEKYLWIDYTFIKSTDAITTEKIDHSFIETPHIDKYELLKKFMLTHNSQKTIVFVQTKRDTEILANKLMDDWLKASFLNWDMRQRERFKALKDFQDGYSNIFVVTDVAARWLNMKNIELVVNFDVPTDPESYIHRIGRTGRAWASGKAIMFVSGSERYALKNIERTNKIKIKQVDHEWEEMVRTEEKTGWRGWSFSGGRWGRGWWGGWGRGWFGGGRGRSSWGSSYWGDRSRSSGGSSFGSERRSFGWERSASPERTFWWDRFAPTERRSFSSDRTTFSPERKSFSSDRVPVSPERKSFWGDRFGNPERKSFDSDRWNGWFGRKSDSNHTNEHKEGWYFQKRDEKRGQRSTTRRDSRDDRGQSRWR